MTDFDTIWRTQDEIRTVVNAVLGECVWNLSYDERRMGKNPYGKRITVGNKELMIIPDAVHNDLYDDKNNRVPYDKMEAFFRENLR